MYPRICKPLLSNSFFLFGSRGVGKTSLLKTLFKSIQPQLWVNLLNQTEYFEYSSHPSLLYERAEKLNAKGWIIIDEVQRIPSILNTVHDLIENKGLKFALTGSSSRKLKRGASNLLAGRAFLNFLHPLTYQELQSDFDLGTALAYGSLPRIFGLSTEEEKQEYLRTYAEVYLKEEIKEEQIIRKLEPFLRFLPVAAQAHGTIINYSKVSRDASVEVKAVERYFEILEDTLLGFYLPPFHTSIRKRQTQKSKFFIFDLGVKRALERSLRIPLQKKTYAYGNAFESFFILECHRLNQYHKKDFQFSYFRTKDGAEIDLVIERPNEKRLLIEIKSTDLVQELEINKALAIQKDLPHSELVFAAQEKTARTVNGVEILPWRLLLDRIFS